MSVNIDEKRALVIGASGLVGTELLKISLVRHEYSQVIALTRSALPVEHPKLKVIVCDLNDSNAVEDALADVNATDVFCCLGTTIKRAGSQEAFRYVDVELPLIVARRMKQRGMEHFLIVTAIGSDPNSRVFYSRMKGIVEQQLRALKIPRLSIFRPSLLLGNRREFRLAEKLSILITSCFRFAMVGAMKKYKPIHAEQVAKSMFAIATRAVTEKDSNECSVTVLENRQMFDFTEKLR